MNKIIFFLFSLLFLVSCSTHKVRQNEGEEYIEEIVYRAEGKATLEGRRILEVSDEMIVKKVIIKGACWDFINGVYNKAGFPDQKRITTFKSKLHGPYLKDFNDDAIQPGDWLYFVNHSFNDIEHSAIFVGWTDESTHEALMVTYVGGNQKKPAFYRRYILDNIYNVTRPKF